MPTEYATIRPVVDKAFAIAFGLGKRNEPGSSAWDIYEFENGAIKVRYEFAADASGAHNGRLLVTSQGNEVFDWDLSAIYSPRDIRKLTTYTPGPWEQELNVHFEDAKNTSGARWILNEMAEYDERLKNVPASQQ